MPKTSKTIYTIGHSNLPLTDFIRILKKDQIDTIVDVRTIPYSTHCPHFNAKPLGRALEAENIHYLYRGKNLGGKGVNVRYKDAIKELAGMVKTGKRVCVMCSEGDYKNCHRYLKLTPSFKKQGLLVTHLNNDQRPSRHK